MGCLVSLGRPRRVWVGGFVRKAVRLTAWQCVDAVRVRLIGPVGGNRLVLRALDLVIACH